MWVRFILPIFWNSLEKANQASPSQQRKRANRIHKIKKMKPHYQLKKCPAWHHSTLLAQWGSKREIDNWREKVNGSNILSKQKLSFFLEIIFLHFQVILVTFYESPKLIFTKQEIVHEYFSRKILCKSQNTLHFDDDSLEKKIYLIPGLDSTYWKPICTTAAKKAWNFFLPLLNSARAWQDLLSL